MQPNQAFAHRLGMKKILLLTGLLFLMTRPSMATHIAGGDFTVEWVSGNNFRVTLKLFRDCASGGAGFDSPITVAVYDNVTNVLHSTFSMSSPTITNIALGDACYSPPSSVCIQEGVYQTVITLPNNPNGYYLAWERCCRNPTIQNINLPGNAGMVFYVQVPDPVLQNSTPIFGAYPATGYLCNGLENTIDFGVTEADGDSLVFSLITPLMGSGTSVTSPTLVGAALPKPYVTINWQPPYSLANIVGGVPPMTIDPNTGVITCFPTGTGVFTFAVMCMEYRAGVKISETIRDIQYYVLPCVIDDLPEIMLPDTISVSEGTNACFDIVVIDADATDTISILVSSPITFADGATLTMPAPFSIIGTDTLYQFHFTNETTGLPDSVLLHAPISSGGAYYGIGGIGLHYCWATECEDIDNSPFVLEVAAFSLGCSGDTNFVNQTTQIYVEPIPLPEQEILLPPTINVFAGEQPCFDIVVLSTDPTDTVSITVNGPPGSVLSNPPMVSPGMHQYYYWNDSTGAKDSIILPTPVQTGNVYSTTAGGVGLHYCWLTECEDILVSPIDVTVTSFGLACNGDTLSITNSTQIIVNPPPYPEQTIYIPPVINVSSGDEPCFDIVVLSENPTDTVNIVPSGPTFPAGAILTQPAPVSPGLYQYFFVNPTTGQQDSVILAAPTVNGPVYTGVGGVGLHYCWQTSCEDVDVSPFTIDVMAYDPGCNGDTSFINQTTIVNISPIIPPNQNVYLPDSIVLLAQDGTCFDAVILSQSATDPVTAVISSPSFDAGAAVSTTSSNYVYWSPDVFDFDTISLAGATPLGNGHYMGIGGIGLHYCWTTDCGDISDQEYLIKVAAYRIGCYGDTTFVTNHMTIRVDAPEGMSGVVPNVFTPNGDGINDIFKLGGLWNYCYDTIDVKIYNRWGQLVFQSNTPTFEWDGTNLKGEELSEGVYYVLLNGIFGDADVTRHYSVNLFRNK